MCFAFGSCDAADVNAVLQAMSIHIFFRHGGQTFLIDQRRLTVNAMLARANRGTLLRLSDIPENYATKVRDEQRFVTFI